MYHYLNHLKKLFIITISLLLFSALYCSDRTDAIALQKQSTDELAILEIAVKNYGTDKEIADFEQAGKLIKMGNLKLNQTSFLESQDNYKKSLALQYTIAKKLAEIYLKRTELVIDEVGMDLIDYSDQPEIQKYFKIAAENLASAKKSYGMKHYSQVLNSCRSAKNYTLNTYTLVKKAIPDKYKKDIADNNRKIF